MAAPKIIVLGSLNGNLEPAFKKLAALHAKNSFALALLTGDVFGPETDDDETRSAAIDALLAGTLTVPLPTYFTVGSRPLPARVVARIEEAAADGGDVCPNLHFLGRRSVTKTSDGLRIVSFGGALMTTADGAGGKEQHLPFHTEEDARSLKGAHGADVLLTSTWPASIWGGGSKVALDAAHREHVAASRCVAELCAALRPRYHLTASPGPFFYEREPFVQAADAANPDVVSVTRFISMAPFGNAAKQKSLYAFALNKSDDVVPAGATASPLLPRDRKRQRGGDDNAPSSYSRFGHHHHHDGHHKRRRQAQPPPGPDQCFFCLSNPRTATHMICSIGEDAYVTTAKGPLPPSSSPDSALGFPGHLIVIPLAHTPTLSTSSEEAARTRREMTRFRESIQASVSARSRRSLGVVTWEVSRARNVHLIWQLVAVPATLIAEGLAEAALRVEADRAGYPAFSKTDLAEEESGDFVRVWLWGDGEDEVLRGTTLVMRLEPEARFDLQFVRRALAKLLGLEERAVWQECQQTEEEETKDAEAFRDGFKEWDFTLE
ncbi:CwfJ domain protein [Cordyceps fumosorosea ARSEF 2679]|uniref:CwfJ domain protein n=1 Tax=Cordyceps fumosorosea (strain ARSEF 2679) TaxID=1081104 RepID=A0A168CJF5_CORFA|nr:CwfJ domain protein [Cordyceps fumosorosea ARSEF 2679]OAA71451.1 CwfJ domain protein [Cordyceps fumosorosea ARSEF 2679]